MRLRYFTVYTVIFSFYLLLMACQTNQSVLNGPLQGVKINFRDTMKDLRVPIRSVGIAGTFNDWNTNTHLLEDDDEDGVWTITLHLKSGRYKYMFIINGYLWVTPSDAREYVDDGFGNLNAIIEISDKTGGNIKN